MPCARFDEWLAGQERGEGSTLPDELARHAAQCPDCAASLAVLRDLQRQAAACTLPTAGFDRAWGRVAAGLNAPSGATTPVPGAAPALFGWGGWTLALALGVVLLGLGLPLFWGSGRGEGPRPGVPAGGGPSRGGAPSGPVAAVAGLSGGRAEVLAPETGGPVGRRDALVAGDRVRFGPGAVGVALAWRQGATVSFDGSGLVTLTPAGFRVVSGAFQATFVRPGSQVLRIAIPGAVLGIRGTVIRFAFNEREGWLDLVSGVVEVEPASADLAPFVWPAGTRLILRAGRLQGGPVALPTVTGAMRAGPASGPVAVPPWLSPATAPIAPTLASPATSPATATAGLAPALDPTDAAGPPVPASPAGSVSPSGAGDPLDATLAE